MFNPNNPRNLGHMQGKILNPAGQHPDEFFSSPAVSISGWAPFGMSNGNVRIAFSEQVFTDGKHHPRGAVEMPLELFNKFIESLLKFQQLNVATKKEVPNVGS